MFSSVVTDYWSAAFSDGDVSWGDGEFTVAVNADLSEDRRVMTLQTCDGRAGAVLTPSVAGALGWSREGAPTSESRFRQALRDAGVRMYDADYLFYYAESELRTLMQQAPCDGVRQLSGADAAYFGEFTASAPEQDLDDAYVELDHWAVFAAFENDRVVSAASMYPWGNARLADLGVLTLPTHRGRGHARAVVQAACRYAAEHGYQPQYRCQLDNHASIALAKAAGLTRFGTWEVVSPDQHPSDS
jgi:GNAT superfamily N-acetyltransferase